MSCYLVNPEHISVLVSAFRNIRGGYYYSTIKNKQMDASEIKEILINGNANGVSSRYNETSDSAWIKACLDCNHSDVKLTATEKLQLLACLDYQSCDVDNYRSTEMYQLVNQMQSAFISTLSEYDNCNWEYEK